MLLHLVLGIAALAIAVPASAEPALEDGLAGAIRGCEEWVLNPASWSDGVDPFLSAVGLGEQMGLVESVDEASLPPPELRAANHHWRINSTAEAGYVLVVSDRLPFCHITGGGGSDLQPVVERVLESEAFQASWERTDQNSRDDLVSTVFQSREEPAFTIVISRAREAGQRLDRVQVLATAMMDLGG